MSKSIKYRDYSITQQVHRVYAFIDGVQTGFDKIEEAQRAIDEMIERRKTIKNNIGKLRSMPFGDTWAAFVKEQQNKGRSAVTLRNYELTLSSIRKHKTITETKDFNKELFVKWLAGYPNAGTKRQHFMNMRSFVNYCIQQNYLIDHKILDIECAEAKGERGKRAATDEEIRTINEWMAHRRNGNIPLAWRLGIETGLRTAEIVGLRKKDFDATACEIKVFAQKTGKARIIKISKETAELLRKTQGTEWLIPKDDGGKYTTTAVQTMIKRMREETGISNDISFYSLRKRLSNLVYRIGGVAEEAKIMGHTSEVALSNYIRVDDKHSEKINEAAIGYQKQETPPATKESLLEQLKKLPKEEQAKLLMELLK